MLVVETVARIRREFFVKGKSIKEIVRDLGVSRNTVRKVLRSGETAFAYERSVQPLPKLGPWTADLDRLLETNDRKARRERLTMIRVFEELQGLGYRGGYDAVRRYATAWHRERSVATAAAYVPLSFAPGEAYQFDWSHEIVVIAGVTTTVKVAHMRLCHSRMFYVRAYPRESQEMVFDAHDRAFAFFGGACQRGIYDNMKTAVDAIFVGRERKYNRRFEQMCGHYLVEPVACTPASGWEKGQVEKNVQDARRRLWQRLPSFPDIDALNAWLEEQCITQWGEIQHGGLPGTVADVHAAEVDSLMPLGRPFDGFVEHTKRVSPICLVHFERNRYSVPASFANRPVSVRIYPERIVVAAEGQILCEHSRIIDRSHHTGGRTVYDWRHYLAVIQRKPGALRNGAPFTQLPEAFKQLQSQLLRRPGGDREMAEILALVLQHDEQAVLCAVELALEAGVATKTHVLNLLHRLTDGKAPPASPIDAPQALRLVQEPLANVGRYDALRDGGLRHAS
jgi:transposase